MYSYLTVPHESIVCLKLTNSKVSSADLKVRAILYIPLINREGGHYREISDRGYASRPWSEISL